MSERRHIFYNVVKDENSLTELLRNFLEYALFRQLFFRQVLKLTDVQVPAADEITTQRRLGDFGQPDVYVSTSEADLFIEVKVNHVGLTDSQPTRYLEYLLQSKKQHKKLFFLLPEGYGHKPEVENRVSTFCQRYLDQEMPLVSVHSWNEVIHLIDQYDLHRVSPLFADFRALLKSWFEPPVVILNAHLIRRMFQTDIPALLMKLYATIDTLSGTLSKEYQITKKKNENEYGLYLYTREGTPLMYVGVWYGFWQQTGSPFCLAVAAHEHGADAVDRFRQYCRETHRGEPLHLAGWEGTGIPESRFQTAGGTGAAELTKVVETELNALIKYLSPGSST